MASNNHQVMVILSDGKPVTMIKTKEESPGKSNMAKTLGRNLSSDCSAKTLGRNLSSDCSSRDSSDVHSSRPEKDRSKDKDSDEHIELRRLRTENQLLQERISHMEEMMTTEKKEKDFHIEKLKKQIIEMDECEKSTRTTVAHLMSRIQELQNLLDSRTLEKMDLEVQVVQDELVASKLREAEANSSFKELQQKLHQLEKQWQLYHEDPKSVKVVKGGKEAGGELESKTKSHLELKEQLMAMRIRETSLISDLNEVRQKLMELETNNHILERQTKRQENENSKLVEKIVNLEVNEKELNNTIITMERKVSDLEAKQKEDIVLLKIREAEFCQTVAEMRRRIAEMEIENQEHLTSAQLHSKDQEVKELENRILELQDEILQLKLRTSDAATADDFNPMSIMTESFIGDNVCLQPTNFESLVDFSKDFISQINDNEPLSDHD